MQYTYQIFNLSMRSILDNCCIKNSKDELVNISDIELEDDNNCPSEISAAKELLVDLSDPFVFQAVVQSTEEYADCAYFYQLITCISDKDKFSENRNNSKILRDKVVYIDFAGIFDLNEEPEENGKNNTASSKNKKNQAEIDKRKKYQYAIENIIFKNNFKIKFDKNNENEMIFLPFDKSNSMARNGRMSFIKKTYSEKMNNRLMLDMDLSEQEIQLSKLYAYRGLYLSSATRIYNSELFPLNEKTVIVLPDENTNNNKAKYNYISGKQDKDNSETEEYVRWKKDIFKDQKIELNHFDGEGLISPSYADYVNRAYHGKTDIDYLAKSFNENLSQSPNNIEEIKTKSYAAAKQILNKRKSIIENLFKKWEKDINEGLTDEAKSFFTEEIFEKFYEDNILDEEILHDEIVNYTDKILSKNYPYYKALKEKNVLDILSNNDCFWSMQFRMPFAKGMLHTVDFQDFFKANGIGKTVTVLDCFGIKRGLSKAHIIMTESQFKCKKWLEKYCENNNIKDPMKYYFEKFKKYHHALYISNTDKMLSNSNTVQLNYQFLSVMQLDNSAIEELMNNQKKHIDLLNLENIFTNGLSELSQDTEDQNSEKLKIDLESQSAWFKILKRSDGKAVSDEKIAGMLRGMQANKIQNIATGNIDVKGTLRFLTRDLMALMVHVLNQVENNNENRNFEGNDYILYDEKINLPCCEMASKLKTVSKVALFRSPHLSRNEEWIATIDPDVSSIKERNKYLGHLKGICEIGFKTLANEYLGGADFDGDLVKVVFDNTVVSAVETGCYKDEKRNKLLVKIPKTISTPKNPPASFDYETIKNTFSSRVGILSNQAIKYGRYEYFLDETKYEDKCAEATFLTGLEIDSAKNGQKPALYNYLNGLDEKDNPCTFFDDKNKIKAFNRFNVVSKAIEKDNEKNVLAYKFFDNSWPQNYVITLKPGEKTPNIDQLTWYYADYIATKDSDSKFKPTENYFSALKIDKTTKEQKIENILKKCQSVLKYASDIYRAEQCYLNSNHAHCIDNIVELQYDSINDKFSDYFNIENDDGKTVKEVRDEAYEAVSAAIRNKMLSYKSDNDKNAALKLLNKEYLKPLISVKWQNCSDEKTKKDIITELLELEPSENTIRFFSNFSCGGCYLLYYAVKDVLCYIGANYDDIIKAENSETSVDIEVENGQTKNDENPQSKSDDYIKEYLNIYREGKKNKSGQNWKKDLYEQVRKDINEIMSDTSSAVKYVYSQKKYNNIFWELFTADEIYAATGKDRSKGEEKQQCLTK